MQGWPLSVPGRWRIMRSNGLSVKFIGLTSLFCQRQHSTPLQSVIKELPAFLRPCSMQLFHFGTIAALEPERQAGRIALTVVFRIQHPLAVGPVLDAVQMQQEGLIDEIFLKPLDYRKLTEKIGKLLAGEPDLTTV